MKNNSRGKLLAVLLSVCMIFQTISIMTVYADVTGNNNTPLKEVYGLLEADGKVYEADAEGTRISNTIISNKSITNLFVASGVTEITKNNFNECPILTTVD